MTRKPHTGAGRLKTAAAAALGLTLFVAGFLSAKIYDTYRSQADVADVRRSEVRLGLNTFGYQFINPLLACDPITESGRHSELVPFQEKVVRFIEDRHRRGLADHVSAVFRDMNNGVSFGIAGDEPFFPASLLKVPDMIAYYKWAESDPLLLRKKLKFENLPDLNRMQNFKPARTLQYGASYTIEDLIYRTIAYSDNNADNLLTKYMPRKVADRVYTDLGLAFPQAVGYDEEMSVAEYSAFFKILFNASYLTKDFSEKALRLLAEPDFPSGLSAGVPGNIKIAQKFGERVLRGPGGSVQLHDCGIIYYPEHPYLLCVMTRGASFENLAGTIRDLSRLVFEEVDRQFR